MNKKGFTIFLLVGVFLGILLAWHINTPLPISGGFISDEIKAKDELLKDFVDEQSFLKSRIVSLREEVEELENKLEKQSAIYNIGLLESLKTDIGLTEKTGLGLEIVLDDGISALRNSANATDENLVQASDLRDLVNVLNSVDVDAIAINKQRIISTSVISSLGNSILINNSQTTPPFTITVIGDSDIILQRLLDDSILPGIYEKLSNDNIIFKIYKKNLVKVPIYNSDLQTNLINLSE